LALIAPAFGQSGWISTYVVNAGTYGNGEVFVVFADTVNEPGCATSRLEVPATHADVKTVLSIAYAAMATGPRVMVDSNGCFGGFPTLDTTTSSGFQMFGS
jgi:hypothetical protein